jgi:hypothetical protein
MAKKPNINISDDLLKMIMKQLNTKTGRNFRKIGVGNTTGSSKFPKEIVAKPKPKPTFTTPIKKGTRPIVAAKPKPKGVGKIANVKPERPKYDYVPKGKKMAQTTSEQKAAERLGNRLIRMDGGVPTKPKAGGTAKPVDVRGSIVKPPDKASMRPVKPSKGSYEGDKMRGQAKDDAARIGRGQKPPKRPKPPAAGSAAKKPASPKSPKGGAGAKRKPAEAGAFPAMTTKQKRTLKIQSDVDKIQDRIANAKTPKQKRNAELLLRNRILEAASKSRSGYGKYSGTRPISDR